MGDGMNEIYELTKQKLASNLEYMNLIRQCPDVPIMFPELRRLKAEQISAADFLKTHKRAISFKWRGNRYGFFDSFLAADIAWADQLRAEGYVPRKWWQISRWGEETPPKEVLALLET